MYKFAVVSLFTNNCVIINYNYSKSIFLRRETWKVSCVVCEEKKFDYHCHVLVFGFRLISASILYIREKRSHSKTTQLL